MRHLADGFVHAAKIEVFLRYPKPFPVDIRHNAKIGRETLTAWAAKQPLVSSPCVQGEAGRG